MYPAAAAPPVFNHRMPSGKHRWRFLFLLLSLYPITASGQELLLGNIAPAESPGRMADTNSIRELIQNGQSSIDRDPDYAIFVLTESLRQSGYANYPAGITSSLKSIAKAYVNKGQTDSLTWLCSQLLIRYSYSPYALEIVPAVYIVLGNVSNIKNEYRQAARYYFEALKLTGESGINQSGSVYNNLATVFITLGQYQEALSYLHQAEQLARHDKNPEILGYILLNRGLIYNVLRKPTSSKQYLDSALETAQANQFIQLEYLALTHTGSLYLEQNRPERALQYLSSAVNIQGQISPDYLVFAKILTGEARWHLKQYEKAKSSLIDALNIAREYKINELPIHARLADIYKAQGNYKDALTHFQIYKQQNDESANKDIRQHINQLNISYQSSQKDRELTKNQLLISMQKNKLKTQRLWLIGTSSFALLLGFCLWTLYRTFKHKQQLDEKTLEINHLKAMLLGEEKERSRIARELHDGIVSQLMAIRLNIQHLKDSESVILPAELEDVHNQVKDAAEDLRRASHNLIPDSMQEHGLAIAVTLLCEKTEKNSGLKIKLEIFNAIPRFDPDMELSSFRMIQELLHNIIKHANARSALVQLSCHNGVLNITVEDDGIGMTKNNKTGTGLKNIRDRIKTINGSIHIESLANEGTAIYIEHDINITNKDFANAY